MLDFQIKTPPTAEPVLLAEIRQTLGITNDGDINRDTVIEGRIKAAREWVETHTRLALITQTWTGYACKWQSRFDLKAKLQSVSSVKYLDTDGNLQTLESSQYQVDLFNSRLYPAYGVTWPALREQFNAVQIEFVSGYGNAGSYVPQGIREAITFIVGQWENYQSSIEGAVRPSTVPYAVLELLRPFVDMRNSF